MNFPGPSPAVIANDINHRFTSVADDIPCLDYNNLPAYLPAESPVTSVSAQEVYKKLRKVQAYKSGGPEHIPPRLIKEFAYELCFLLTDIFNCSLQYGIIPVIWKTAHVVPVPKKHPPTMDKLRPISLTCTFAKIQEDSVTT